MRIKKRMITFVGTFIYKITMKNFCLLLVVFAALVGCNAQNETESAYANSSAWYASAKPYDTSLADVFFVLPTVVQDWTDDQGVVHHHADPNNPAIRAKMDAFFVQCDPLFSDSCNFVAPYYRQITIESWALGDAVIDERFVAAMGDVQQAFEYYITHRNPDRPFVLAGYSQGGKAVVELLKAMSDDTYKRMVAAYVIGFRVTREDRAGCSRLVAAADSLDTGVTVCYNSVASVDGVSPVLSGGTMCINPLNWHTDATPASVWDTVSVSADAAHALLIVSGLDPKRYFRPQLEALFPMGCYHSQELGLYGPSLQRNVKQRIAAFDKWYKKTK